MSDKDLSRLSRLTAILPLLQSKRLVTATSLANRFRISIRTVYRDIRALEAAGVPVLTEDGRGYSLMQGYTLPPVMFTETEANALITAGQLVATNKDASFVSNFTEALTKIKAVLKYPARDKADLLTERVHFRINQSAETTSNSLSVIQLATTNLNVLRIAYRAEDGQLTDRMIEPLGMYSTQENWILIAHCRLRNELRAFRLDRVERLEDTYLRFEPHQFTLRQYFEDCKAQALRTPDTRLS